MLLIMQKMSIFTETADRVLKGAKSSQQKSGSEQKKRK